MKPAWSREAVEGYTETLVQKTNKNKTNKKATKTKTEGRCYNEVGYQPQMSRKLGTVCAPMHMVYVSNYMGGAGRGIWKKFKVTLM